MQLDALTAGTALILVQLCVALVMTGIFYATHGEKCTRYWALSGFSVGIGLLISFVNAGAPRPAILLTANSFLLLGAVFQWCGIRAFYRKSRTYSGWIIAAIFITLYSWVLLQNGGIRERVLVISPALVTLTLLCLHEIRTGQGGRYSFASMLTSGAVSILAICHAVRTYLVATKPVATLPDSLLSVALVYLVPTAGTMLMSCGLLLMYFERIVADKHKLATHDDLTGVLNRRAIVGAGEREIAAAVRMNRSVAVAFIDIDYFKQINDSAGHEAGDRVLIEIADVLVQTCRRIDLVGRYGGEEFCIILPGVDQDSLSVIGERLVSAIREHRFSEGRRVTISVGLAALTGTEHDCSWARLIVDADRELYKAKAAGRDCYSLRSTKSLASLRRLPDTANPLDKPVIHPE